MAEIIDMKDDIVDWLIVINILSMFVSLFVFSKLLFIITISINILLNGTFIVMSKWGDKFVDQQNKKDGGKDGDVQGQGAGTQE